MKKGYKRLSLEQRVIIQIELSHNSSYGSISKSLGRSVSCIQREVSPWGRARYDAVKAHQYAQKGAKSRKQGKIKLRINERLNKYVSRKLELRWSPEQFSFSLKSEFPTEPSMQVSPETIYRYVYLHAKKSLREELAAQLRRKKSSRGGVRKEADKRGKIAGAVSIEDRPDEVKGREIPGHWEGDLVVGKNHKTAIGTLVERTTRTIIIVPLKGMDAVSVRQAFEEEFKNIPAQMKKTMTYDNGKEMAQHKIFTEHTKISVYFAHPYT